MGESVCVCVSVCDVEQLECSTRTTEIFPRTSLYITQKPSDMPFSFFSCLFPELAYKLNHPQSHRAGILILKDLCCKAHCFAPLCFQPPRELYGRFSQKLPPNIGLICTEQGRFLFKKSHGEMQFSLHKQYMNTFSVGKKKMQTFQSKNKSSLTTTCNLSPSPEVNHCYEFVGVLSCLTYLQLYLQN